MDKFFLKLIVIAATVLFIGCEFEATEADLTSLSEGEQISFSKQFEAVYLINAGSLKNFTASDGRIWEADRYYSGGTRLDRKLHINGTHDQHLFQTERFCMSSYVLPVINANYKVKLHFSENYYDFDKIGKRVFDVSVENKKISGIDIFKQVGLYNVLTKTFDVTVTDGKINIVFSKKIDCPVVMGIEVLADTLQVTSPAPITPSSGSAIRINSGSSSSFQDNLGNTWLSDRNFKGGGAAKRSGVSISGDAAGDSVYLHERYCLDGYEVPVAKGDYEVYLHFAETFSEITKAGERVFDIQVENSSLKNFDIFSAGGNSRNKAVVKKFNVTVADTGLSVTFTAKSQCAMINGIEILPAGSASGSDRVPASVTDDSPPPVSNNGGSSTSKAIFRISAGASANYKDAKGNTWLKDTYFQGGATINWGDKKYQNTSDPALFRSERYGLNGYRIPVAKGTYSVNLHFAEGYNQFVKAGQRVFDYEVEGTKVSSFDIVKKAGGNYRAIVEKHKVVVNDGYIDIRFTKRVDNTVLHALEVFSESSSSPAPSPSPSPSPTPAPSPAPAPVPGNNYAETWIRNHFKSANKVTGNFTGKGQQRLKPPVLIHDAIHGGNIEGAAFDIRDERDVPRRYDTGLVNLRINQLNVARDKKQSWAAGIQFHHRMESHQSDGAIRAAYLYNVTIEPKFSPAFTDYSEFNADGITFNETQDIYAQDVTILNNYSDAGIDLKADRAQFVNLKIIGPTNRSLRLQRSGPYYLVNSRIDNPGGIGMQQSITFTYCGEGKDGKPAPVPELRLYKTTFNGSSTPKISCANGTKYKLTILNKDPRTTGEMHPMFKP